VVALTGVQVQKVADPGTWGCHLLKDGVEELAEYEAGSGERVARWDHDPTRIDALLAQVTGVGAAGKTHAVTDALGSVYALTNTAGSATARYSYDAYGTRTAVGTETTPTAWGFTGREHDPMGLMYYRARYYEPTAGRFLTKDPLGDVDGPNRYQYVSANPIAFNDPSGLCMDPGGPGPRICIDTFIPDRRVGGIGFGDFRGPMAYGGTYRTRQFIQSIGTFLMQETKFEAGLSIRDRIRH